MKTAQPASDVPGATLPEWTVTVDGASPTTRPVSGWPAPSSSTAPSTAAALAERLGLTPAAIRRHLDVLRRAGHLVERASSGSTARAVVAARPRSSCSPTPAGPSSTPPTTTSRCRRCEFLAAGRRPGRGRAVRRAPDRRRSRLATRSGWPTPARRRHPGPGAGRGADRARATSPRRGRRSPGSSSASTTARWPTSPSEFPQLCEAETEVFSRLVGVHVQRLATIAHGDGVCTTHIPRASGTHSHRRRTSA